MNFSIQGGAAGPFLANGGGRIEGVTGAIGGMDTLYTILGSIPTPKDIPAYSQQAFTRALRGFRAAPTALQVDETVATDWTDSNGQLGQGASLLTSSLPLANPRQLHFSWKPGQSSYNVWWELENRLSVENAQSQDFLAGVWAAIAATAALMCLALLGSTCRDLITRYLGKEPLAVTAAMLDGGVAAFYLWLVHQQTVSFSLEFLVILLAGILLTAYGAFWHLPYRRIALWSAVVMLTLSALLASALFIYIWLPVLASAILVLLSILHLGRYGQNLAQHVKARLREAYRRREQLGP